ncbi:putative Ig domain-containing protein [Shewanella sedimentimangrovi]|uniref:VCBS repeat-containing protein n=1 Tax=Shewanella sedimentimangrovi TaxID=2814293 RepID=A0ABX7QWZ5_9GAMM|nr:putative Ig domain-containing protein [Shewanella sedimentimangrovi]QSX36018.1 VCBS repeat-containing protein [Shewanella sedimentimangrovi]
MATGQVSQLTYTLSNASTSDATDVGFDVTLDSPALSFAGVNSLTTNCDASTGSAVFNGNQLTLSGYRVTGSGSCVVNVYVAADTTGAATVANLSSSLGAGTGRSDTLTVDGTIITAAMTAAEASVNVGAVNRMTVSFSNSADNSWGYSFSLPLPTNVALASPVNFVTDCPNLASSSVAGATTVSMTSTGNPIFTVIGNGASCSASFDVLASSAGSYDLVSNNFTYYNQSNQQKNSGRVAASFDVVMPAVSVYANPHSLVPGSSGSLEFTISNFDRSNDASNIGFTLDLDTALSGLVATGLPITDVCGSGATLSGTGVVTLSGANLTASDTCSFSLPITAPANAAVGDYTLTVSNIALDRGGSTENLPDNTTGLAIINAPQLAMTLLEASATAGSTVTLHYVLTNIDTVNAASNISFSSVFSALPGVALGLPGSNYCSGSGSSIQTTNLDVVYANYSGISLAAGGSCNFDLTLTLPSDMSSGSYTVYSNQVSATINSNAVSGNAPSASVDIAVDAAPSLTVSFADTVVQPGDSTTLYLEIAHGINSSADATDIAFTVDLDSVMSGLAATSLPSTLSCGSSSSLTGTGQLSFSSGSLAAGDSCTLAIPVQIPVSALGSYTLTSSSLTAMVNGNAVQQSGSSAGITVSGLTYSKSFNPSSIRVGSGGTTIDLDYVFTNQAGGTDATSVSFTESLNSIYSGVTIASATQNDFCGAGSATSGTTTYIFSNMTIPAGSSCAFSITLNIPAAIPVNNIYGSTSSNVSADIGGVLSLPNMSASFTVDSLSVLTSVNVSSPTSQSTVLMSISFSADVTGFDVSDISVTNATLNNFSGSGTDYTVEVTPTLDGDVTLDIAAGVAMDASDNSITNKAATQISFEYQTTPLIPTPSLTIGSPSDSIASQGPITFAVSYLDVEQVNLLASDINLNTTGDASATVSVLNGDTSSATVVLNNLTGNGTLGINIAAGTARYSVNEAPAAGPSGVFSVDTRKPLVSLSSLASQYTGNFTVNIQFDENVTGFSVDDIGVSNGSLSNFQVTDAKNYSVTVSASGESTVTLSLAADVASDTAGNGNDAATNLVIGYDDVSPTVTLGGASGTVATAFTATIDFSEDVSGFVVGDIQVSNANLSSFTSISASQYTVLVTPVTQAEVTLDVAAAVADDSFGNLNLAATQLAVVYDYNDAPVISGSPSSSVAEDSAYSFTPVATDADVADTLSFSISGQPSWASFDTGTGTLSGTPVNDDVGSYSNIIISVSDGSLSDALATFSITVTNTNDAPVITGTPATSANEDSAYSFTPSASDVDVGDVLSFSISGQPSWASFNTSTGTLSGTPVNSDVGSYSNIIISVSDGTVSTALSAFSITVVNTNDAPVISGTPATSVNEDSAYSFTPSASDVDVGDVLSFSISGKPSWASFDSSTGTLSGTPVNGDVGSYSNIIISVSDGTVSVALSAFSITVINSNDAPVISGTPATSVNEDSAYSFTPSASDVDVGDSLSFSISGQPSWASFDANTGTLSGTPVNSDVGSYSNIIISVSDGTVSTALPSFSIAVINANDAPVISGIPATSVDEDSAYNFTPSASDVDVGDVLTFSISGKPAWASFDTTTGMLSGTPVNADVGVYNNIIISVSDGTVEASLPAFSIEVVNVNDLPVFESSPVLQIAALENYSYALVVTDVDVGSEVSLTLIQAPDWLTLNGTELTGMAPLSAIGQSFAVTVSANDGVALESVEQSFNIEVTEPLETQLQGKLQISPAPAAKGDVVSLTLELENLGSTAAHGVGFELMLTNELAFTQVPNVCSQISSTHIECVPNDSIASKSTAKWIAKAEVKKVSTGFSTASLMATADNLSEPMQQVQATVLLANVVASLPGDVLTSTSSGVGYVADINGDGFTDLLDYVAASESLELWLNNGSGALVKDASIQLGTDINSLVVADLDMDGQLDLLTTGGSTATNHAFMLESDLSIRADITLDAVQADLALVADLDNDQIPEVVLAGQYQSSIALYQFVGTDAQTLTLLELPALQAQAQAKRQAVAAQAAGGILGLTLTSNNGQAALLVSDGSQLVLLSFDGADWTQSSLSVAVSAPGKLVSGDVDANGEDDLFIDGADGWTLVLNGYTDNAVKVEQAFPVAEDVVITDLDDDGVAEVLFVTGQGVSIWHYDAAQMLVLDPQVIESANLVDLGLLDIDGDGDLDLLTFDAVNGISVWYFSQDGDIGKQDVELVLYTDMPSFPQLGMSSPYRWRIDNLSTAEAKDVSVLLRIQAGLRLDKAPATCLATGLGLRCSLGSLMAADSKSVELWLTPMNAGNFSITASVSGSDNDRNPDNNSVTSGISVAEPAKRDSSGGALGLLALMLMGMTLIARRKMRY